MVRKLVVSLFLILLFASFAYSSSITMTPGSFTLELTGGSNITRNITVRWNGNNNVLCYIDTEIKPDGDGLNVSYSENNPFMLPANSDYTVSVTIKSAINIIPDVYTITSFFSVESKEDKLVVTPSKTTNNGEEYMPSDDPDENQSDTPADDEGNSKEEDTDTDSNEKPKDDGKETKEDNALLYLFFVIIIFISIFMLLFLYIRRRKEKNGK